jgi:hypothetical protein
VPDDLIKSLGTTRLEISLGRPGRSRRPEKDILVLQEPSAELDGFMLRAKEDTKEKYGGDDTVEAVRVELRSSGHTEDIAKVTAKLEASGLDRTERLLLAIPGVYASLIGAAITLAESHKFNLEDTAGLYNFVRRRLGEVGGPREAFTKSLLDKVLVKRGTSIEDALKALILNELRQMEIPLKADRAEETILAVVDQFREKGNYAAAVKLYATKNEIDPDRFTAPVQARMVNYLKKIGVEFTTAGLTGGAYDEYLALAYQQAISAGNGASADPIDAVRNKGAISDWDFSVDAFDTVEEQGVIPQNILAAGALDYIYNLGERLGMFRLADAVVLRWGSGTIDLDPGETPAKLYRYWKLRAERTSPEERGMLYKRVLNQGEGELLEGMVSNDAFPELWGALMTAVADYIARIEEKKSEENSVSRQRIYQATKQLQYNLTEFTTGMAQMQITEMYHHLQEARGILEDNQIVDYFGSGRRKTIWTVIERGSKEWFDYAPNIAAIRDAAVQGNKVFQWIAYFDQATVTDADFQEFRDAAEAWILAHGAGDAGMPVESPEPEDSDAAPAKKDTKDDFDSDWDA